MKRLARVLATGVIVVLLALGGVGTAQAEQNNALTDDQYAAFGLNLPDASTNGHGNVRRNIGRWRGRKDNPCQHG